MKIFILIYKENKLINSVSLASRWNKSEDELMEAVEKFNSEDNDYRYEVLDITNETEIRAFKYLLGDGEYAKTRKMRDLYARLMDVKEEAERMQSDIYDLENFAESTMKEVKQFLTKEEI